jgi:hypothetical protein
MSESSEEDESDRSNSLKSPFEFILDSDGSAEGGPWNRRRRRGQDAGQPRGAGRRRIWPNLAAAGMAASGGSRKGEKERVGNLKLQRAFSAGWHSGRLAIL